MEIPILVLIQPDKVGKDGLRGIELGIHVFDRQLRVEAFFFETRPDARHDPVRPLEPRMIGVKNQNMRSGPVPGGECCAMQKEKGEKKPAEEVSAQGRS